ncbi:hypothetical protein FB451DRAFT_1175236 [Mycena latifolia]|nr:hypothetical protein FB451DRAFT_1175236 [Mycena latifolia]
MLATDCVHDLRHLKKSRRQQIREADAQGNELKFVAKYGHEAFMEFYFPKYAELGKQYLPQLRFEEGPAAAKKKRKLRNSSRAGTGHLITSEIHVFRVPTEYLGTSNYVSDNEHDSNPRKFWFLVLSEGLFTKKTDADLLCPGPGAIGIHIAASGTLMKLSCKTPCCSLLFCPPIHATKAKTPSVRAPPKTSAAPKASAVPNASTGARKCEGTSTTIKRKPSVPVKREKGGVAVKREPSASMKLEPRAPRKLPLYLDGSDEDEDDVPEHADVLLPLYRDESPPHDSASCCMRSVRGVTSTPPAGAKRARGSAKSSASRLAHRSLSPVPLSPSVSSASSISTATTAASSASAVAPRRVPHAAIAQLVAVASNTSASGSCTPSMRLLYNSTKRTLYKDGESSAGDEFGGQRAGRGLRRRGGLLCGAEREDVGVTLCSARDGLGAASFLLAPFLVLLSDMVLVPSASFGGNNSFAGNNSMADDPSETSPSPDAAPQKRRVVDFELDDDEWEDEDAQLEGLGTTMHWSRNRSHPVIPIRKHRCIIHGANSRTAVEA